ncbi:MAG: TolC family protein [Gammaproteobacteria bacterium]
MPRVIALALALATLVGCAWQSYVAAPPDETRVPNEIAAARLDAPDQLELLARAGVPHAAASAWTPGQLALVAVARSPQLLAARSAIAAAIARSRLARQRRNPQLNLGIERHSEREDWSDSRWSVGPSIDLTLVPPVVRRLTGERADLDVALARLEALEIAWQARAAANDAALAVLASQEASEPAAAATRLRDEAVAAARALVAAGVSDAFEWQTMMLERNDARLAQLSRTTAGAAAQAALAATLSAPLSAVSDLALVADAPMPVPDYDALRARMLKSHPGVLQALAAHAQAERDLALAVAAQYPSLQLSPGYFFDQGDHVWSLLGGVVVPLFARNEVAIESAAAARDAACAAVYAAQAEAIAELQRRHAAWRAATTVLAEARAIVADIVAAHAELLRKREAGIGDDLAVARAGLQVAEARLQLATAAAEERRTRAALLASARVADLDPPFARVLDELTATAPAAEAAAR